MTVLPRHPVAGTPGPDGPSSAMATISKIRWISTYVLVVASVVGGAVTGFKAVIVIMTLAGVPSAIFTYAVVARRWPHLPVVAQVLHACDVRGRRAVLLALVSAIVVLLGVTVSTANVLGPWAVLLVSMPVHVMELGFGTVREHARRARIQVG